jgi:hypothetical protein
MIQFKKTIYNMSQGGSSYTLDTIKSYSKDKKSY